MSFSSIEGVAECRTIVSGVLMACRARSDQSRFRYSQAVICCRYELQFGDPGERREGKLGGIALRLSGGGGFAPSGEFGQNTWSDTAQYTHHIAEHLRPRRRISRLDLHGDQFRK